MNTGAFLFKSAFLSKALVSLSVVEDLAGL